MKPSSPQPDPPAEAGAGKATLEPLAWREAVTFAGAVTLVWRGVLGVIMGAAWWVASPHLSLGPDPGTTLFNGLPWYTSKVGQAILGVWPRWDAIHHLNLARLGYIGVGVPDSVYYPLYASTVGAISRWITHDYVVAGLIVSTLATAASLTFLFLIADQLYSRRTARMSVLVLAAYPTAFFLMAPFTESLFIGLTLGAFLAAYRQQWWLAGPPAFLASLARGPGMLTGAALAWLGWVQWRRAAKPQPFRALLPSLVSAGLAVLGGVSFQVWRAVAGFPPMATILQTGSKLAWVGPILGTYDAFAQVIARPEFLTVLETTSAVLFASLLVAMLARPRWRRGEWLIYTAVNLVLFTGVHTFEASAWRSIARYVLILFPAFIVLADGLSSASQRIRFVFFSISLALQIVFASLYTVFWFLG